jgi:signal transduction histidine kinase
VRNWARSLQGQLVLRLAAVFAAATALGVGALVLEGSQAANTLGDDELERRAVQIARYIERGSDGTLRLQLPPRLQQLYNSPARTRLLAVRAPDGRLIASSDPLFAAAIADWPADSARRHAFRLDQLGPASEDYNGLTVRVDSVAGPLSVSVAAASDAEALADGLLRGLTADAAWALPVFMAAMLAVAVWSIRRGLRPVLAASEQAAAIGPAATGVRLPTAGQPAELLPLVSAVNRALDRLEQGFQTQRQFTANAAHELRTPLSILTAGLDGLSSTPEIEKLREDAARMNRLVAQLLRVARLDSIPIDVSARIDLRRTAAQVVEYMSPWAVRQQRALGFEAQAAPVWVRGNADALADALRNLVENAVHHTPAGTEVTVAVAPDGTVRVGDHGPGVLEEDRLHIFERFWRGRGLRRQGAGLGLAIVAEIVKAHHGRIEVSNAPDGGALFELHLPLAP